MVEVYGQHGEYLQTVRGALLDNIDNTPLYENHIKLSKWQSEVLLKVFQLFPNKQPTIENTNLIFSFAELTRLRVFGYMESLLSQSFVGISTKLATAPYLLMKLNLANCCCP